MKLIKRLFAVLLAVIILALSLPTATVFAADSDMRYGRTKLDTNMQKVYDQLVTGCANNTPTEIPIDPSWNITADQLHEVFKMFYSDYPEYFWVTNGLYGWSTLGTTVVSFTPNYCVSNIANAKSAYNTKVDELTSGLSGKSDYEKAKILHDRLIDTVTYISTENDQTAYGALVEGKAVCNGYAKAYQHLLLKAGIPAWFVSGSSINPHTNTPEPHAWNLVKIDGQWYYTDVTWDDQKEHTLYTYFNITTKQLEEDHTIEDIPNTTKDYKGLVPNATEKSANYYVKNNLVFSSYNKSQLADLLKNTPGHSVQVYIDGDTNKFDNDFWENYQALFADIGAVGGTVSQIGRVRMISVTIVESSHTHKPQTTKQQVNPTCLTNGTKAHYICDCGLKFSDSSCTKPIVNESELNIPASSHTPSGWKNDATSHWKECTKCGSETANTRDAHSDNNKDNKCDTCGFALPVADSNGNIVISGGSTNNNSSNNSNNQSPTQKPNNNNTVTPSTNNDASSESETEFTTDKDITIDENIIVDTDEATSTYEESYLYGGGNPDGTVLKWIVICGVAAIFVAMAVTTTVILINKKHT